MSQPPAKTRIFEPRARLIAARQRKYATPEEAASAMGIPAPTYRGHENGSRGLSRNAERYARFFGVPLDWLLTGRGSMTGAQTIPVFGRIGAGAVVTMDGDEAERSKGEAAEFPSPFECWAFVVEGDSMRPRFYPGEVVVFANTPDAEDRLVGQYCLAQLLATGERFVKILRPGRAPNRWRLESHNADPMEDVELLAAWRWRATLPSRDGAATLVAEVKRSLRPRPR